MSEIEVTSAEKLLEELRWTADRIVVSPTYGERYWLKECPGGITDCCPAAEPCEHHARLTHQAVRE